MRPSNEGRCTGITINNHDGADFVSIAINNCLADDRSTEKKERVSRERYSINPIALQLGRSIEY